MLAQTLIDADVRIVKLIACGMKMPYTECENLNCLEGPPQGRRFDVGQNISASVIPLFNIADGYNGTIFPMVGDMGAGYGSVMVKKGHEYKQFQKHRLSATPM